MEWPPLFEKLIRDEAPDLGAHEGLNPDSPLIELGIDSFGMLDLCLNFEEAFGVDVPDELLVPEVFETPRTIWKHLCALLREDASKGGVSESLG